MWFREEDEIKETKEIGKLFLIANTKQYMITFSHSLLFKMSKLNILFLHKPFILF